MKKGFTLIELLAVIVILGVISLITSPIVINVIDSSKKESFRLICNEIYNAYDNYEIQEGVIGSKHIIFDFNSRRKETEIIDGIKYVPTSMLFLDGELPKSGKYEIKNGKRSLVVDNGKYTCVKDETRYELLEGVVGDNDITPPVVRDIVLSSTTKSIKVIVGGYEEDGLITKYYYQINNGELIPSDTNVYVFDNLNTKEEYEIKVYVENKSGLKSEVLSKKIETKEISGTTYEESYEETEYEYVTSKTVTIKYDSQEGLNYYFKTDVEIEVVSGVIEECGLDTVPGSCTSTDVTVLETNKWYRTKESLISILFKQEGNIYTVVSDGKNTSIENTYEVSKIDHIDPSVSASVSGKTATFTISDNIGIVSYGVNQSEENEPTYTEITSTTSDNISWTATAPGTYVVWVKDVAGRIAKAEFTVDSSSFCAYEEGHVWTFDYSGSSEEFIVPCDGTYKIETWGAQGGSYCYTSNYNLGAYASGYISLYKEKRLFVYVGLSTNTRGVQAYNGGGIGYESNYASSYAKIGAFSGGGATDVRLVDGVWNDFDSLKSRIIVAAGAGGSGTSGPTRDCSVTHICEGRSGGGLIGINNSDVIFGGTQISSGYCTYSSYCGVGSFGIGGNSVANNHSNGGGGGGYYGGAADRSAYQVGTSGLKGGASGSSFISGHNGCNAIAESSTSSNIVHTGQSIHYSGLYFTNTVMVDGYGYNWTTERGDYTGMPSHDGTSIIRGNSGSGYAKITLISLSDGKIYNATLETETYPAEKTNSTYTATASTSSTCILPKYTCPNGSVGYGMDMSSHLCPGQGVYDYSDCKQWSNPTTTYSCPNGGTLSGSTCTKTAYTCPSGGTLSGTTCTKTVYTCPNGGTLSGTTCVVN